MTENTPRQNTQGTHSYSIDKKCVIRRGRCHTHRVELVQKKTFRQILVRDTKGNMSFKKVEVFKMVCSRQLERDTTSSDSVGQGELLE